MGIDRRRADWKTIPGIGVRVSNFRAPVPDVLIRPADPRTGSLCDDVIVAFEVLFPSTTDHNLRWKRKACADLPSLAAVEVVAYDRAASWAERRLESADSGLGLPALGLHLPLAQIYWQTGPVDAQGLAVDCRIETLTGSCVGHFRPICLSEFSDSEAL